MTCQTDPTYWIRRLYGEWRAGYPDACHGVAVLNQRVAMGAASSRDLSILQGLQAVHHQTPALDESASHRIMSLVAHASRRPLSYVPVEIGKGGGGHHGGGGGGHHGGGGTIVRHRGGGWGGWGGGGWGGGWWGYPQTWAYPQQCVWGADGRVWCWNAWYGWQVVA